MWLKARGSSAQQIAAAREEAERNPELWKLLYLQKAEKLTDSRLVVLKVFSDIVFPTQKKPPEPNQKNQWHYSVYVCAEKKKKKSDKYTTTIAFYLPIAPDIESSHGWIPDGEAFNFIF